MELLEIAKQTEGFSGSDLREMCRDGALLCVRDFVHTGGDGSVTPPSAMAPPTVPRCFSRHVASFTISPFVTFSPSEDCIRPIHASDLQRAIAKMKKSKMAGGHGALLHAALD